MTTGREVNVRIHFGDDGTARVLDNAGKELKNLGKRAEDTRSSFSKFSAAIITLNQGLALMRQAMRAVNVVAQATIGTFISQESAFAGVRKTVDATEAGFQKLRGAFKAMSERKPIAFEDLSRIGELAGQLGVQGVDNIAKFTDVLADVSVTTNLTAEAAATAFAKISNIMQEPIANVDRMASAVIFLGNNSASTEAELVEFARRVASAGAIVGLTTAQVLGISSAFVSVGIQAAAGGSAVQKTLLGINNAVIKGTDELRVFADTANVTVQQFKELWKTQPAETFIKVIEGLSRQGTKAAITLDRLQLSDLRVTRALLSSANAGDLLREQLEGSTQAWIDNIARTEEARKRYKTLESQLGILSNITKNLFSVVGEEAAPALQKLIRQLQSAAGANELEDSFRDLGKELGKLIASIGQDLPSLVKDLGLLASGAAKIGSSLRTLTGAFTALPGPVQDVGIIAAVLFGLGPMRAVITAIIIALSKTDAALRKLGFTTKSLAQEQFGDFMAEQAKRSRDAIESTLSATIIGIDRAVKAGDKSLAILLGGKLLQNVRTFSDEFAARFGNNIKFSRALTEDLKRVNGVLVKLSEEARVQGKPGVPGLPSNTEITESSKLLNQLRSDVLQLEAAQAQALAQQTGDFTRYNEVRRKQIDATLKADLLAISDVMAGEEARTLAFKKAALARDKIDEQVRQKMAQRQVSMKINFELFDLDVARAKALAQQADYEQKVSEIRSGLEADLAAIRAARAPKAMMLAFVKASKLLQAANNAAKEQVKLQEQVKDAEGEMTLALMTESEKRILIAENEMKERQALFAEAFAKGVINEQQLTQALELTVAVNRKAVNDLTAIYVNFGDVLNDVIDNMVNGWIRGTLDIQSAMEAMQRAGKGIVAKMFQEILEDKLKFDDTFIGNFLNDIPNSIKGGLEKGTGFFTKFFASIPGIGSLFSGGGREIQGPPAPGQTMGTVGGAAGLGGANAAIIAAIALGVAHAIGTAFETIDKEPFGFRTFEGREKFMRDFARGFLSTFGINIGKKQGEYLTKFSPVAGANRILSGQPEAQDFIAAPVYAGLSKIFGINVFGKGPTLGTQFRESAVRILKDADVAFANELSRKRFGLKSAKAWAKANARNLEEGLANFVERDAPELFEKAGKRIFALGAILTAAGLGVGSEERGKFGDVKPQRGLSSFANMVAEAFGGDLEKAEAFVKDATGKLELTLTDAARAISELFPLFTPEGLAKTTFDPNDPQFDNLVAAFQRNLKDALEGIVTLFGEIPNDIVAAATAQEIWNRAMEQGTISAKEIERVITSAKASIDTLSEGIKAGFQAAINAGDATVAFDAFSESVTGTVRDAVLNGLLEAFLQSAAIQNVLQPFFETLSLSLEQVIAGELSAGDAAGQITEAWAEARGELELLRPVIDEIAGIGVDIANTFGDDLADGISNATDKAKELQATLDSVQLAQANFNTNLTSRIAELRGDEIGAIKSRVPQPAQRFLVVKQQFIEGGTFDEQTARLQEMSDLLERLLDLRIQEIQADFKARREQVQADFEARRDATQARIDALNDERDAINETADAAIQARQEELDLVREWVSILSSAGSTIDRLKGGNLSPESPFQQMQAFLTEFRSLQSDLGSNDQKARQAAARRLLELGPMILQLAQQAGIGQGSAQFVTLWTEILDVLDRVKDQAQDGADRAETLQQEIKDLDQDRNDRLAAIDTKIQTQQDILTQLSKDEQATLERLSKDEQAQIKAAQEEVAAVLQWIQDEGNALFEARKSEVVGELLSVQDLLKQIRDILDSGDQTPDTGPREPNQGITNAGIAFKMPVGRAIGQFGIGNMSEADARQLMLDAFNTAASSLRQMLESGQIGPDQFTFAVRQFTSFYASNLNVFNRLKAGIITTTEALQQFTQLTNTFLDALVRGPQPMGAGGTGIVTGPKTFLAGEAGPEAFAFGPIGTPLGNAIVALGQVANGVKMPPRSTAPAGQPVGFAGTSVTIGKIEQRNDVQIDGTFDLQNNPGDVKAIFKTIFRETLAEVLDEPEIKKRIATAVKHENAGVA